MSVQNATLLAGSPTPGAWTGGTSKTYAANGTLVNNGLQIQQSDITDIRTRPTITCKNFPSAVGKDGFYGKARRELTLTTPYLEAVTNKQKFASLKIILTDYPDFPAADRNDLVCRGSQSLQDSDFTSFFANGSLL